VVALAEPGLTGPSGARNREILATAMSLGADLVGGCPSLDADPPSAITELLSIARDAGCGLDLHVDETTNPSVLALRELARQVVATGFDRPVTASHCVSLGAQDRATSSQVAREVADAGISVVTLPQSNLFLQGRDAPRSTPRGLTAVHELREAGVVLAGGGDNWRDPFNPMGRIDPLETASLLVAAGQLSPEAAYDCVAAGARSALGLPPVRIEAGFPADLLAVRGGGLLDVVASGDPSRVVLRAGRVLADTRVHRAWHPALARLSGEAGIPVSS
jgi:cytosine deaminase